MVGARVVTKLLDGREFASSGLGGNISKEVLAESIEQSGPSPEGHEDAFSQGDFDGFIDVLHQSVVQGTSEAETIDLLQSRLAPFVMSQISLADDDVLVDYTKLMVEEYAALGRQEPDLPLRLCGGAAKQDVPANL